MKTVLVAVCTLFFSFHSSAQSRQEEYILWPTDANTEKIVFSESVFMPGATANILYANAIRFAKNAFKGEKDSIIQNDTTKTLFCKSAFFIPVEELGERGKGYISFSFSVWCHKNSYKYQITDFEHFPVNADGVVGGPLENDKAASGNMLFPPKYWNDQKAKCYYRVQTTIEQFKEAMNKDIES